MDTALTMLLNSVRDGDADAFAALNQRYSPLVQSVLRRCGADADKNLAEDLRQEAEIALYIAACTYDVSRKDVTFGLYAGVCIKNRVISALRRERRQASLLRGSEDISGLSGISGAELSLRDYQDPADTAVSAEEYRILLEKISRLLTGYELIVFDMYLRGMRTGEVAQRLERDKKSVENAMCRIRRKIKAMLGDGR